MGGLDRAPHTSRPSERPGKPGALLYVTPRVSALSSSSTILETKALTVRFGGLAALSNVSLSVARGEIRGVIGPNGAGKSTFFNCLTGVLRPTSGRIVFNGEDIAGLPPYTISRKAIARSYQITNLLPGATVLENVRIAAQSRRHNWSMLRHHRAYRDVIDRDLTILIVEHDMEVVMGLAPTITVLNYGEVLAEGRPAEIQANPRVQEVYLKG